MPLVSSGQISLNDIKTELGAASTNVSLRSMSSTAGFSSPDAMSEFYGFSGVLLDTITPNSTGTTYTFTGNYSLTPYAGQSRRLVIQYTSGTSYTGDVQIHSVSFNGTGHGPFSGYYYPPPDPTGLQTSRAAETNYSSAVFYDLATGTTANRWNIRSGANTPSSDTGIDGAQYLSQRTYTFGPYSFYVVNYYNPGFKYIYAETSSPGSPNKDFWIRTTAQTIVSGRNASFYYVGNGATVGTIKVWLV